MTTFGSVCHKTNLAKPAQLERDLSHSNDFHHLIQGKRFAASKMSEEETRGEIARWLASKEIEELVVAFVHLQKELEMAIVPRIPKCGFEALGANLQTHMSNK